MAMVVKRSSTKAAAKIRRHGRVRKKLAGTSERPRMVVNRSSRHVFVQIIDDAKGATLVSASTMEADLRRADDKKVDKAKAVGALLAQRAREVGITAVVFDRGGNKYHGRVAAIAEGARDGGLNL